MSSALISRSNASAVQRKPDLKIVREFVEASLSPRTLAAYSTCLADFVGYCREEGFSALPAEPETVAAYLATRARDGRSVSTLNQRLAAIKWSHESRDLVSPTTAKGVRATMAGIRRKVGVAPKRKAAATAERVAAMVAHIDRSTLIGKRNAALLLFGFATAMRRSELVGLDWSDLDVEKGGAMVFLARSKGDQEGAGHTRYVPNGRSAETCPIRALSAWRKAAGLDGGRIFRSVARGGQVGESVGARTVATVVKRYAEAAGLDPADFGGHSLRAGFVTSSAEKGARSPQIMAHTGHKSEAMIRVYTRPSDLRENHPGRGLL